jgi:hypothetical protein
VKRPEKLAGELRETYKTLSAPNTTENLAKKLEYGHDLIKWLAKNPKYLGASVLAGGLTYLGAKKIQNRSEEK